VTRCGETGESAFLDAALQTALASVRTGDPETDTAEHNHSMRGDVSDVSLEDYRKLALLVLGFDRGRHRNATNATLAAAATLLAKRGDDKKKGIEGENPMGNHRKHKKKPAEDRTGTGAYLSLDHRNATVVGQSTPGPDTDKSCIVNGAAVTVTNCSLNEDFFDALLEKKKQNKKIAFRALLLDDNTLCDDSSCCMGKQCNMGNATNNATAKADAICERIAGAGGCDVVITARLWSESYGFLVGRLFAEFGALVVQGAGAKALRRVGDVTGTRPVLDATEIRAEHVAGGVSSFRKTHKVCLALQSGIDFGGWETDDTSRPIGSFADKTGTHTSHRRVVCVTRREGQGPSDGHGTSKPGSYEQTGKPGSYAQTVSTPTCAALLFDRTAVGVETLADEFARTLRKVGNVLSHDQTIYPYDGAGTVCPGGGVLELACAFVLHRKSVAIGNDARNALKEVNDEEKFVARALLAAAGNFGVDERAFHQSFIDATNAFHDDDETGNGAMEHGDDDSLPACVFGLGRLRARLAADRERKTYEKETRGAAVYGVFAEALRDMFRISAQNGGARFDDAVRGGNRCEAKLAECLLDDSACKRLDPEAWRGLFHTLHSHERADETREENTTHSTKHNRYRLPLEDIASRVAGIHTALAIARCTIGAGAVVTTR
jgi:hypothetical protein